MHSSGAGTGFDEREVGVADGVDVGINLIVLQEVGGKHRGALGQGHGFRRDPRRRKEYPRILVVARPGRPDVDPFPAEVGNTLDRVIAPRDDRQRLHVEAEHRAQLRPRRPLPRAASLTRGFQHVGLGDPERGLSAEDGGDVGRRSLGFGGGKSHPILDAGPVEHLCDGACGRIVGAGHVAGSDRQFRLLDGGRHGYG